MENGLLKKRLGEHADAFALLLTDKQLQQSVEKVAQKIIECYKKGGKVIFMGNGGSAAEAQHMAAELLGKYLKDRPALPAIALTANSSTVTAIANDTGYGEVFRRQLEALAAKQDVVIGYSTSGNSENVVEAIKHAKSKGIFTVAFVGKATCRLDKEADMCIKAPGKTVPSIQEMHTVLSHAICEIVEETLFS